MKFLIALTCSFLIFCTASAQNPPQPVNNWYKYKGLTADSLLQVPAKLATQYGFKVPRNLYYNVADSLRIHMYTGHNDLGLGGAANGLNDSAGTSLLGGTIYKPTKITINQGQPLTIYIPGTNVGPVASFNIGQGGNNQNGFFVPFVIGDSLDYIGNNDPFMAMTSIDYTAGPNGVLYLNYQPVADSPQFNERVFTPTIQASTYSLDINGNPYTNPFTSAWDIFFYGDLTGGQTHGMTGANFVQMHNGPCCFLGAPYGTVFSVDEFNNVLIGPGKDTTTARGIGYAIPYARLDIRPSQFDATHIGLFVEDPIDTSKIAGTLKVGGTSVGAVIYPRYTTTQKLAIVSPTEGEQVYDITLHQMSYYNGTTWINF